MIFATGSNPTASNYVAGTFLVRTDQNVLYVNVSGSGWEQINQETSTTYTPTSDGGVNLGSTALRFADVFVKTGINVGGTSTPAYPVEARGPASTQLHVTDHDADDAGYIMGLHGNALFLMMGCSYNGAAFVAKETAASVISIGNSSIVVYVNTGLTVGNTFSLTQVASISSAGSLNLATVNATSGYEFNGTRRCKRIVYRHRHNRV